MAMSRGLVSLLPFEVCHVRELILGKFGLVFSSLPDLLPFEYQLSLRRAALKSKFLLK